MMQGSRKSTAKSEAMTMNVLQSRCLSGVRIKANNNEATNHEAVKTEAVFGKPLVYDDVV